MIICTWGTVHFSIPTTRHSLIHRLLLQAAWMFIALIAPEALLYIAIHQRIDASALEKKAMKYLPSQQRAKPGMLARIFKYILGQGTSVDVST